MSDRLLKESDVLRIAFQLPLVVNSAFADAVKALPSADRPQAEWIFHYRDKWMVKAECPKCHRRFKFSPRGIWKCCPMCETRMKGADDVL